MPELIRDFLVGPSDTRVRDTSIDFNVFSVQNDPPLASGSASTSLRQRSEFTSELKKFCAQNSNIDPITHQKFFTYFFIGSLITLPYTGLMEINEIPKMLVKLDHSVVRYAGNAAGETVEKVIPTGLKVAYPVYKHNERKLALRTVVFTDESPIEITDVRDFAFSDAELKEIIDHFRINQLTLTQLKFDWKILKTFRAPDNQAKSATSATSSNPFEVYWAEVINHKIPIQMSKFLKTVGQSRSNAQAGQRGDFQEIKLVRSSKMDIFLDPLKSFVSATTAEQTKQASLSFMENMYAIQEYYPKLFGPEADSEVYAGYVAGSVVFNTRDRFKIDVFNQGAGPSENVYALIFTPKHDISLHGLTLAIPAVFQITSRGNKDYASLQVTNSHENGPDVSISSVVTSNKFTSEIFVDFKNPTIREAIRGSVTRINEAFIPQLINNFERYSQNFDVPFFSNYLQHELRCIFYQVQNQNFELVTNYLLGQLCLSNNPSVISAFDYPRYLYTFDEPNLKANIRSLLIKVPNFLVAINLIGDTTADIVKQFVKDNYRFYIIRNFPDAAISNELVHLDFILSEGHVNVKISTLDQPQLQTPPTIYSGQSLVIKTIEANKLMSDIESDKISEASNYLSSLAKDLKPLLQRGQQIGAFLAGIFSKDFIVLPSINDRLTNNKPTLTLLKIEDTTAVLPDLIQKQISNMDLWTSGELETEIMIKLISPEVAAPVYVGFNSKLPLPKTVFSIKFDHNNDDTFAQIRLNENFEKLKILGDAVDEVECLPNIRRRRTAIIKSMPTKCPLTWSDVDEINDEKIDRRNKNAIKINALKFLRLSNRGNDPKRLNKLLDFFSTSRINFAKKLTGLYATEIVTLIEQKRMLQKLTAVGQVSNAATLGIIYKNIAIDLYNGNYGGAILSSALLGGSYLVPKGLHLLATKNIIQLPSRLKFASSILRTSKPFLRRFASGYNLYNLYQSVVSYSKMGDTGSLVGIIESSTFLLIDAVEIGLELAGLETALSIFGPIGAIVGALVFISAEAHIVHEKLKQVDNVLHLTAGQYFTEGVYTFFTGDVEGIVKDFASEKMMNNYLAEQASNFLTNQTQYKAYIFPVYIYSNEKFHIADHNIILLDKTSSIEWPDIRPDSNTFKTGQTNMLCFTSETYERIDHKKDETFFNEMKEGLTNLWKFISVPFRSKPVGEIRYVCENSLGVVKKQCKEQDTSKEGILIDLKDGDDVVRAFETDFHTYFLGNGDKTIIGNSENDTFVFTGNLTTGHINALNGINVADFSSYATNSSEKLVLRADANYLHTLLRGSNAGIHIWNVQKVSGRIQRADYFIVSCYMNYLDGNGGGQGMRDIIEIPDILCYDSLVVIMRDKTTIYNHATVGKFHYVFSLLEGHVHFHLNDRFQTSHNFMFRIFSIVDILRITFLERETLHITFRKNQKTLHVSVHNVHEGCIFHLDDGVTMIIGANHIVQVYLISNYSVKIIVEEYNSIAHKLGVVINVNSPINNASFIIGNSNHHTKHLLKRKEHNVASIIQSDPYSESHLVGGFGENVFYVSVSNGDNVNYSYWMTLPPVIIYVHNNNINNSDDQSHNTIDLRHLVQKFYGGDVVQMMDHVLFFTYNTNIYLNFFTHDDGKMIIDISLKDCLVDKSYQRVSIILRNPMMFNLDDDDCVNGTFCLIPLPIKIDPATNPYTIIDKSHLEPNLQIHIETNNLNATSYMLLRDGKNVIFTIMEDNIAVINNFDPTTIVLKDFYEIKNDKLIDLKINYLNANNNNNFTVHLNWENTRQDVVESVQEKMEHSEKLSQQLLTDLLRTFNKTTPSVTLVR